MRVLFIIKTLRYDGGVETSVASLVNTLISEGANVYIAAFCERTENRLKHRLNLKEDNYLYLGHSGNIFILTWQIVQVIIHLYRHNIDIVHTHLFYPGLVGRFAAFFHRTRTVATEHSTFFDWWKPYHYVIDGFLARHTDALTAVSRSAASTLAARTRVYPDKITVIHNFVDAKLFVPNHNENISIPQQLITVVGRFEYSKNIEYALCVLKALLKKDSGIFMNLIGDGSLYPEIERLIHLHGLTGRVCVIEPIKNFLPVVQTANLLLMSSHWEGYPMTILEAFAAKTLVVGTSVPGITDIIQNEQTGILVEPDNPTEAAEKILRVLNDEEQRARMLNNARFFVEYDSSHNTGQKFIDLYRKMVS